MKILIIEQEKTLLDSLSILMSHHNIDFDLGRSINEGMSLLKKSSFDIVLCRDRLSDGDGLEMLKELGRRNSQMIRILITAHGNTPLKEAAIRGGIRYLEKPFDLEQLEEAMGLPSPWQIKKGGWK